MYLQVKSFIYSPQWQWDFNKLILGFFYLSDFFKLTNNRLIEARESTFYIFSEHKNESEFYISAQSRRRHIVIVNCLLLYLKPSRLRKPSDAAKRRFLITHYKLP